MGCWFGCPSGTDDEFQHKFFDIYQPTLRNTVCGAAMGNHEGKTSKGMLGIGPYYDAYRCPQKAEAGGLASASEAYYSFDFANIHFICLDSHDLDRSPAGVMSQWLRADLEATHQDWIVAYWHHPPYTKGSHDSDKENPLIEMRELIMPVMKRIIVENGSTIIDVNGDALTGVMVDRGGATRDLFRIVKQGTHVPSIVAAPRTLPAYSVSLDKTKRGLSSETPFPKQAKQLIPPNAEWEYLAGRQAAENWTAIETIPEEADGWKIGKASIGYGDSDDITKLKDMMGVARMPKTSQVTKPAVTSISRCEMPPIGWSMMTISCRGEGTADRRDRRAGCTFEHRSSRPGAHPRPAESVAFDPELNFSVTRISSGFGL